MLPGWLWRSGWPHAFWIVEQDRKITVKVRINLLPPELRRTGMDPKMKLLLGASVAGFAVLVLACWGFLVFETSGIREELGVKRQELVGLKAEASKVDSLQDEISDYKERERAIISIKTNRILWSRKLTELVRLTPGHVWIVRLDMQERDPAARPGAGDAPDSGGHLRLLCYSAGSQVGRMTAFREKLKGADEFYLDFLDESLKPGNFYSDFQSISRPEWRSVVLDGYREPNNLRFTIRLDLRKPQASTKTET